jgi:hypothetical protein
LTLDLGRRSVVELFKDVPNFYAGETLSEAVGDRLDSDEEEGALRFELCASDVGISDLSERARVRTLRQKTSWGTMMGRSLNPVSWIKDDGRSPSVRCRITGNDQLTGSLPGERLAEKPP